MSPCVEWTTVRSIVFTRLKTKPQASHGPISRPGPPGAPDGQSRAELLEVSIVAECEHSNHRVLTVWWCTLLCLWMFWGFTVDLLTPEIFHVLHTWTFNFMWFFSFYVNPAVTVALHHVTYTIHTFAWLNLVVLIAGQKFWWGSKTWSHVFLRVFISVYPVGSNVWSCSGCQLPEIETSVTGCCSLVEAK